MDYDFYVEDALFSDEDRGYSDIVENNGVISIYNGDHHEYDCRFFLDLYPDKRYVKFYVDYWDIYSAYYAIYDLSNPDFRQLLLEEKWLSSSPEMVYIGDDYITFSLF